MTTSPGSKRRGTITALILITLAFCSSANEPVVFLEQNWGERERRWFYHFNQGSRLLDYRLFLHLETATDDSRFSSNENLATFGFIPAPVSQYNPDRLPIGFARERDAVGLTCAACHTNEIRYRNKRLRIDGGQAHIDLARFLAALEAALAKANDDDEARRRLAWAMGLDDDTTSKLVAESYEQRSDENRRNASPVHYGPSRLDAFGAILNKGLKLTGADENFNPADGPTSFPYLWDTPQHDWVEWNGSSPNPLDGAFGRNVGEVIGVYGHVDTTPQKLFGVREAGYRSSIRMRAIRRVEKRLATLQSPPWPEQHLTTIDRALAARGKPLFDAYCASCHLPIDRADTERKIQVRMSSLEEAGTDPVMARNAIDALGKSGIFEGLKRFYVGGDVLQAQAPALHIVNHVMVGAILNRPLQGLLAQRDARLLGHGEERHPPKFLDGKPMPHGTETSAKALAAYKARPLNGIWATAPFLHNGSVPNLYELLLPADQRSVTFPLGNWRLNTKYVGYHTSQVCDGDFQFDTRLKGNSNAGHEYGTGDDGKAALTEAQRWALVEYLKTL